MAIVVKFEVTGMPARTYDSVIAALARADLGAPDGRKLHIAYGDPGRLQVIDVFESPAELEAFGAKLMPILQEHGVEARPEILGNVHNLILG